MDTLSINVERESESELINFEIDSNGFTTIELLGLLVVAIIREVRRSDYIEGGN